MGWVLNEYFLSVFTMVKEVDYCKPGKGNSDLLKIHIAEEKVTEVVQCI